MMKKIAQFFFPVWMCDQLSIEGKEALDQSLKEWATGNSDHFRKQNFESRLEDEAVRKQNRERIGPLLKGYAQRWTTVFAAVFLGLLLLLWNHQAMPERSAAIFFLGTLAVFLTGFVMVLFWYLHWHWENRTL